MKNNVLTQIRKLKGKKFDTSQVLSRCGVEIVGTRIRFMKPETNGISRPTLYRAYINNNCCPRIISSNMVKKTLIQALMKM